jgi:hypothetical protein
MPIYGISKKQYRKQHTFQTKHRNDQKIPIKTKTKKITRQPITKQTNIQQQSHPKIQNFTNIQFTTNQTQIPSKGLEYNLHCKQKTGSKP